MPLSNLQQQAARIVLALPEADGFALAGGAALVAHNIVDRGTKDIDCFGPSTAAVNRLVQPAIDALRSAGYEVTLPVHADGFAKHFIDVSALLQHFPAARLCELAAEKDRGFSLAVLAEAFGVLQTYDRADEFPALSDDAYSALLTTFADWQRRLTTGFRLS